MIHTHILSGESNVPFIHVPSSCPKFKTLIKDEIRSFVEKTLIKTCCCIATFKTSLYYLLLKYAVMMSTESISERYNNIVWNYGLSICCYKYLFHNALRKYLYRQAFNALWGQKIKWKSVLHGIIWLWEWLPYYYSSLKFKQILERWW